MDMVGGSKFESFKNVIAEVRESSERVLRIIKINKGFKFFFERKEHGLNFLLHPEIWSPKYTSKLQKLLNRLT